ncbi:hypothetical protein AU468_08235 [Alkalispirochaeta sphaeroplastigenens]|uniref:Transglycosylase SLT domain-containing protein n=1 Tax=Alkalispirochaeta sphaeroplastigenens TaxID=1187066 RepID=A0A2S4JP37_9SPIO|nr:lytic transglycosylase domain-containing protein [Alkalispirochaeta sphaeroplastigenens]POR01297.1 hypothetical protein AU468_08235 [Alkalispirochaeta sphaeroplastigenens]
MTNLLSRASSSGASFSGSLVSGLRAVVLSLGVAVTVAISLSSCGMGDLLPGSEGTPQGLSGRALMERLAFGEGHVLDTLVPTEALVEEIRGLDPSFPYVLGRGYEARDLQETARRVYRWELERGEPSWAGRSALRLARLAAARRRWLASEGYAARGLELEPENRDLWFRLGEALYRQEKYRELLAFTDEMPRSLFLPRAEGGSRGGQYSPGDLGAERLLWRAVAGHHLEEGSNDLFLQAFLEIPAHSIHSRLYLFRYYRDSRFRGFSRDEGALLEAVYRTALEEYDEAQRLFRRIDPAWLAGILHEAPGVLASLTQAASGEGGQATRQWLDRLKGEFQVRGEALPGDTRAEIGREVARAQAHYAPSREEMASFMDEADQAMIESWLSRAIREGAPLPEVVEALKQWGAEPQAFRTALDRLAPGVVRARRWEELEEVYQALPAGALHARAHLAVLTVLAARQGFLELPGGGGDRLDIALELSPTDYYGLLARRLSGRSGELSASGTLLSGETLSGETPSGGMLSGDLEHAAAILASGQHEVAGNLAMAIALDPGEAEPALALASQFSRLGHASTALGLARRAVARGNLPVGEREIALLYPRPFSVEIESAAAQEGVSAAVFYGLVREESHFNPRARSPVGALGLSQIMPASGDDIARRMGWPQPFNLERVSTNLQMGAYYLNLLKTMVPDNLILQVASYNAGPGRGRGWQALFGDLPPELLVEAIPFVETRWYLRRIAVSSAWYQYLLDGTDPAEMPLLR